MDRKDEKSGIERRNFLKAAAAAGAGAAAAPLIGGAAEAKETGSEMTKSRYRETDHVKQFYALNRL
jgi:hypothetical protein